MINVSEARYNSLNHDATGRQLCELDTCISEAANNGLYACVYPGGLTDNAALELEEKGFRFREKFSGGRIYTLIEWGDE